MTISAAATSGSYTIYITLDRYNQLGQSNVANDYGSGAFSISAGSAPATPSSFQAVGNGTTVLLAWNDGSNETGYRIERKTGTGGSYGLLTSPGTNATGYTDASVTAGTTYCYRIQATNAAGSSSFTSDVCATPLDTPVLTAPADGASVSSPVTLSWNAVTGANGYGIRIGTGSCGATNVVSTASPTASYTTGTLSAGTYYWQVQSVNTTYPGLSPFSGCRTFTISAGSAPGAFTLSGTPYCNKTPSAAAAVTLNWTPASAVSTYTVFRNGVALPSGANLGPSQRTFEDSGNVTAGASYTYLVRATNTNGTTESNQLTVAVPSEICATATMPKTPTGLAAFAGSSSTISLVWNDNSSDEGGFKIERKTGSGGTYVQIATTGQNIAAYNDSALAAATQYCYRVRAWNGAGDSGSSNEVCATTHAAPQPDLVPQKVTLSRTSLAAGGSLAVTVVVANQGSGDAAGTITMIRINDSASSSSPDNALQEALATPPVPAGSSVTVSADITIPAAGTYYAHVYVDNASVLSQSNIANDAYDSGSITVTGSAVTPGTPALLSPSDDFTGRLPETFSWQTVPQANRYLFQVSLTPSFLATYDSTVPGSWLLVPDNIPMLQNVAGFHWRVAAVAADGTSGPFSTARRFNFAATSPRVPPPPALLTPAAGQTVDTTSARFSWTAVPSATRYRLTFSTSADFSQGVTIVTVNGHEYSALLRSGRYSVYWKMASGNSAGYGEDSAPSSFVVASAASAELTSLKIDFPPERYPIEQNATLVATASFTGSYAGAIAGYWLIDGQTRTDFSVQRQGLSGNTVTLKLPTGTPATHTVIAVVTSPVVLESQPKSYVVHAAAPVVPAKIDLTMSSWSIPADGQSSTKLTATIRAAGGKLADDPGRVVTFAITEGRPSARLVSATATVTNGVATATVYATLTPGVAVISASSPGLDSDSVTLLIGREQVAKQIRTYLEQLRRLSLPEPSLFRLRTKSYDVTAASALVSRYESSASTADLDALYRLMLAEKAIYHFYGTGETPRAIDNDLRTPGASIMLSDMAEHLADTGGIVFSLAKASSALRAHKLGFLAIGVDKLVAQFLNSAIDLGGVVFDEQLKSVNSRTMDLIMSAIHDEVHQSVTGEIGRDRLVALAKQAAILGMQEFGTAYYVSSTQKAQDAAANAASRHEGHGLLKRAEFDVESHISGARAKTENAHGISENARKASGYMKAASGFSDVATAIAVNPFTVTASITSKALGLLTSAVPAGISARMLTELKNDLPGAVGAAFSQTPTAAPVQIAAYFNSTSLISQQLGLDAAVPHADSAKALLAAPSALMEYEAVAERTIAALDAGDWNVLAVLAERLGTIEKTVATDISVTMAPLEATAPYSVYLTSGFSESYSDVLRHANEASGLRSQFLIAVMAVLNEPGAADLRAVAKGAGKNAIVENSELLKTIQQTGILAAGNPAAPTVTVVAHKIPESVVDGVPFTVSATVLNGGASAAETVTLELRTPSQVTIAPATTVNIGSLAAGERMTVTWEVTLKDARERGVVLFTVLPQSANSVLHRDTLVTSLVRPPSRHRAVRH